MAIAANPPAHQLPARAPVATDDRLDALLAIGVVGDVFAVVHAREGQPWSESEGMPEVLARPCVKLGEASMVVPRQLMLEQRYMPSALPEICNRHSKSISAAQQKYDAAQRKLNNMRDLQQQGRPFNSLRLHLPESYTKAGPAQRNEQIDNGAKELQKLLESNAVNHADAQCNTAYEGLIRAKRLFYDELFEFMNASSLWRPGNARMWTWTLTTAICNVFWALADHELTKRHQQTQRRRERALAQIRRDAAMDVAAAALDEPEQRSLNTIVETMVAKKVAAAMRQHAPAVKPAARKPPNTSNTNSNRGPPDAARQHQPRNGGQGNGRGRGRSQGRGRGGRNQTRQQAARSNPNPRNVSGNGNRNNNRNNTQQQQQQRGNRPAQRGGGGRGRGRGRGKPGTRRA